MAVMSVVCLAHSLEYWRASETVGAMAVLMAAVLAEARAGEVADNVVGSWVGGTAAESVVETEGKSVEMLVDQLVAWMVCVWESLKVGTWAGHSAAKKVETVVGARADVNRLWMDE